jgi:hypothetical protein
MFGGAMFAESMLERSVPRLHGLAEVSIFRFKSFIRVIL